VLGLAKNRFGVPLLPLHQKIGLRAKTFVLDPSKKEMHNSPERPNTGRLPGEEEENESLEFEGDNLE
jgi:hypothetical protein